MPAPYDEYDRLPETMFIRRPYLENLLRRLLLPPSKVVSNIHTITGSVRSLEVTSSSGNVSRVGAVIIRQQNGDEITINDPTLVTGSFQSPMYAHTIKCAPCYRLLWRQPGRS